MLKKVMILTASGYALIVVLVLALGLMAIASMNRLHAINHELYAHPFTVNGAALDLKSAISLMRADMLDVASPNTPEEVGRLSAETIALDAEARKDLTIVEANFLGDIARVQGIRQRLDAWQTLRTREFDLVRRGRMAQTDRLVKSEGGRIYTQLAADVDYLVGSSVRRAEAFVAESDKASVGNIRTTWWLLSGLLAFISITGGIIAWRIASLIRIEEQMDGALRKYSAQLEASNKELESFSYSVSHDLRVPLRAVDGFSRLLLEEYQDKLDAEGKRLLNVVRDNTKRMAQLIDDILAFSRTGRLEITRSEVDMEDLVRDVMAEHRAGHGRTGGAAGTQAAAVCSCRPLHDAPCLGQSALQCGQVQPPQSRGADRGGRDQPRP